MARTFYFYDTETSGIRASSSRVMQFGGQRTDEDLNPLGEPDDILIALSNDILPDPDAVLVHGISPQQTLQEGITEADFCRYFHERIATPDTVIMGFNSVRFDDEFMRYMMYRNFYEPYEWQWKDGRSRWDILDALRMMRALRPDGIEWPFDENGKPTVRLTAMTEANDFDHKDAHTALADVHATIAIARLMKQAQPKLFDYLLALRSKKEVQKIVESGVPYLYTSGKYSNDYLKTTLVSTLFKHPKQDAAIVYDLRVDPEPFFAMTVEELTASWQAKYGEDVVRLPIKTLKYNRCPAVAVQDVLKVPGTVERIQLDVTLAQEHLRKLVANPAFTDRISEALGILQDKQEALQLDTSDVDEKLYESFWNEHDRAMLQTVREHSPATLGELLPKIQSKRMQKLLPLYKARNYREFLNPEEYDAYEVYRQEKLLGGVSSVYTRFAERLQTLSEERKTDRDQYLLTELQLYAESILPIAD